MKKMVMMKKIDDLNNEKGEKKWQSKVLEMKIEDFLKSVTFEDESSSVIICDYEKKNKDSVDTCNKCLELEAELVKKNNVYIELSKRFSNLEQHCISLEVAVQLNKEIFQKDKSSDNPNNPKIQEYFKQNDLNAQLQGKDTSMENADLKAQIQEKVFANTTLKNKLRKLKGKTVIDTIVSKPYATTIAPGMFKLDLEPLALQVLKNKDTHLNYIKHSKEHADTLWEIIKSARSLSPLDSNLDSAFVVTPKNKDKKVRFAYPVTSSSNTQKQVDSHKPKDSNQPLLHSIGVIGSTDASGSKPTGNTKNNRISQSSSSNKTNKIEDQSRSIKSRKNKKNRVTKIECNAYVMQSMLNANSKSICAIYNECLFDANHDKCVLDYVHDVNVLSKSKPAKCKNTKHIWKPTGKVYTEIGYKWKLTGHTFTIVKNKCPLTRFTSTKLVPLKETTTKSIFTLTQGIMVYSRRPKAPKSVGLGSKSKIIESSISNTSDPIQSRRSIVSNVPSYSLIDCKLSKLLCGIWMPDAPSI
ncbi:hypothetical protein Tco_0660542 [Tanacetum coccineum]